MKLGALATHQPTVARKGLLLHGRPLANVDILLLVAGVGDEFELRPVDIGGAGPVQELCLSPNFGPRSSTYMACETISAVQGLGRYD